MSPTLQLTVKIPVTREAWSTRNDGLWPDLQVELLVDLTADVALEVDGYRIRYRSATDDRRGSFINRPEALTFHELWLADSMLIESYEMLSGESLSADRGAA